MGEDGVRTAVGWAGILASAGVIASAPLYFVYSGPPPVWNVLTRDLLTVVTCGALLVFVAGFAHLARRSHAQADFLASVAAGAGFIFVAITLMAASLEAGVVFGAPDGSLDPTIDGPLAHANMLAHGPVKRMLTAVFLIAACRAAGAGGLLPRWLRWLGYAIAAANLAFVPSLYFGTDPTDFYAVHSWANSAVTGSFLFYWILAVGVVLIWRRRRATTVAE